MVGRTDVLERGVVAEGQESKPDAVEDVDHASDSGVLPEGHDSLSVLVDHLLVVDKTNLLLEASVQKRHVVGLSLVGHRK